MFNTSVSIGDNYSPGASNRPVVVNSGAFDLQNLSGMNYNNLVINHPLHQVTDYGYNYTQKML